MNLKEVMGMTRVGEPMEPEPVIELEWHALDLGRPELKVLMNRHSGDEPARRQTSLFAPPAALIVTRKEGEEAVLREAIEAQGWFVKTCAGPGATNCPVMRGEPCALRQSVDAAVVYVDADGLCGGTGNIPRLRCAADSASPGVVAFERRFDPPQFTSTTATIGALRGPGAILAALRRLLQRRV
jgi:hypothetical protein